MVDKVIKIHRIENKNPSQKVKQTFQIILIGNSKVGKTSIIQKCLFNTFSDIYQKSKSFNLFWTNYEINSEIYCLQLWDVSGDEKNVNSVTGKFYKNCNCAFLIYSINDFESFTSIEKWLTDLRRYANDNILTVLIGNKIDIKTERLISYENGKKFKEDNKIDYFIETSAKEGENIENIIKYTIITLFCQIQYSTKIYEKLNESIDRKSNVHIKFRPSQLQRTSLFDSKNKIKKESIKKEEFNDKEENLEQNDKKKLKAGCCFC
jgi:Ras-related protein Rab-1A